MSEQKNIVDQITEQISKLTILQATQLASKLQEKWGISNTSEITSTSASSAKSNEPKIEEKTHFDVIIKSFDANAKIKMIKEVRSITNLGLKQSKDLVESVPAVLKKHIKREEADIIKKKIESAGGKLEIK